MTSIIPANETTTDLAVVSNTRDIVTAKGNIVGTRFTFSLGDTAQLKDAIKSQHPDWSNTRVKNEVARVRADRSAASRLEAQAFIEFQYQNNNVAVLGDHKHSGKSVLRFEKAEVKSAKAPSKADIVAAIARNIAEELNIPFEQAMKIASK